MNSIEIASLNVRGLGDNTKRKELFYWLHKQKSAIIFLQETHSMGNLEKIWRTQWGGDIYFAHGDSNSRGVAILVKKNIPLKINDLISDDNGRYIILDAHVGDKDITLANLYAPNEDSPNFFLEVIEHIENLPNDNRIIAGDFNLVLNTSIDKSGGRLLTHERSKETLELWMQETDLLDIWRHQHPDKYMFTWLRRRPTLVQCRLDFFLVSFGLSSLIESSAILSGFRTDHSIIKINLLLVDQERGHGFWKLNCSLLQEQSY